MTTLTKKEAHDIVEAVFETLEYAFGHAKLLGDEERLKSAVFEDLREAFRSVGFAQMSNVSLTSLRGHVSTAMVYLRSALERSLKIEVDSEHLFFTVSGMARAVSLLHPICATPDVVKRVPQKRRTRRKVVVTHGKTKQLDKFEININDDRNTTFFTGLEGTIESGGLFVATYDIFPMGSQLHMKVRGLPGDRVLTGTAKVAWIREHSDINPEAVPGMGMVFKRFSRAAQKEINKFIAENDSIFFEAV